MIIINWRNAGCARPYHGSTAAGAYMNDTAVAAIRMAKIVSLGKEIEIEYQWIAPELTEQPLVVFLHEGLGSVSMWRDWPRKVCHAIGCRGLVFSRYGYGQSTPRPMDEA